MVCACQFGDVDVVKKVLSKTDYKPCRHALWAACTGGHQGIVQLLMQHGMIVTDVVQVAGGNGASHAANPLHNPNGQVKHWDLTPRTADLLS